MQVIGFTFRSISAEHNEEFKTPPSISTNIEFSNITKEDLPLLKDQDALRISFEFSVIYFPPEEKTEKSKIEDTKNKIIFKGNVLITTTKEEVKGILKSWKKKEIPSNLKIPLFNLIIRRCSTKALDLEDQLGLPLHIPMPQVTLKPHQ